MRAAMAAAIFAFAAGAAGAAPLPALAPPGPGPGLVLVKKDKGGPPPWANSRHNRERRAQQVEERYEPRPVCRTEVTERYDPYTGDIFRRSVEICR